MKMLSLEFSSSRRSAAVLEADADSSHELGRAVESQGRHTRAFHLIETALAQAGLAREAVESLAVGLGPGSYTGIRIAIAIAQGWQLARDVRLLGAGSLEALAWQVARARQEGSFAVAVDAQRREFAVATCRAVAGGLDAMGPLRLVPFEALRDLAKSGLPVLGPDLPPELGGATEVFPEAAAVGALAARSGGFVSGERLEPIYLRASAYTKAPSPRAL